MGPLFASQSATAFVRSFSGSPTPQLTRVSLAPTIAAAARLPMAAELLLDGFAATSHGGAGSSGVLTSPSAIVLRGPRFFSGRPGGHPACSGGGGGLKKFVIDWLPRVSAGSFA